MRQVFRCAGALIIAAGSVPAFGNGMSTAHQFAVTEGGAATASIPIQVPRGIGGMEPQLSLIYPSLVVALGLVITVFLLAFVIPRFSRMYADSNVQLSAATQVVLWVSQTLAERSSWLLCGVAALVVGAVWALRQGAAGRALVLVIEGIAPLRRQWDHFLLAKLYQSLALMVRGGYTLDEALAVGEGLGLGQRMADDVAVARREIARGRSPSLAMASAGLTEIVTERLLAVGERSGHFDGVLQAVADRHAQAFATFIERATRIVEPVLLLLVALLVGGIVVMMYMPIFDMANGIGGGG